MEQEYFNEIDYIDKNVFIELDKWIKSLDEDIKNKCEPLTSKCVSMMIKETLECGVMDLLNDNIVYKE